MIYNDSKILFLMDLTVTKAWSIAERETAWTFTAVYNNQKTRVRLWRHRQPESISGVLIFKNIPLENYQWL